MDFPFPFLNQVEDILNNVESSIVSIPQYVEDEEVNNEDNSAVPSADSASLDSPNNDFAEDRSTSTSVDPNNSGGTILFQSLISTVDGHQTEVVNNGITQPIYDFIDVEVFRSRSNSLTIELITKLCYSVLSGEIIKSDGALEYVKNLSKKLENWITNFSSDLSPDHNLVVINFVHTVKFCLNKYYNLIEFINVNYSKDRLDNFYVLERNNNDSIKRLDVSVRNAIHLFDVVLKLSIKELLLKIDTSEFSEIRYILEITKDFEGLYPQITHVIKLKTNFLLYKWHKRYIRDISSEDDSKLRIENEITSFKSHVHENEAFEFWNKKIEHHYILEEDRRKYIDFAKSTIVKGKDISKLNFFEIHTLIKYYKDISPSEEKLKGIVDYLLDLNTDSRSKYDQYCIDIIRDYAVNNYFSLCSEKKDLSIENYDKLYKDCCDLLSGVSLNYFLQFKYLGFILDKIEKDLSKELNNEKLLVLSDHYYNLIEKKYSKILEEYYDKKNWASDKTNYIFLLTSEESLIDIDTQDKDSGLSSFIVFTSFVLPYNNAEIELNYSKIRQKFREVKSQLKVINTLRNDLHKLDNLNKDFDRKESRNMEIIGLFTAIITFILSSIPAFKFVDNIYQALLFTLSIASSLGLFVLIIFSFTRGARKVFVEERNWVLFFVVCLLAFVTTFSLINFENKSVKGIISAEIKNKKEAKIIDSLKFSSGYKQVVDSILFKNKEQSEIIDSLKKEIKIVKKK